MVFEDQVEFQSFVVAEVDPRGAGTLTFWSEQTMPWRILQSARKRRTQCNTIMLAVRAIVDLGLNS